jgi:hypothetical protein
MCPRALVLAKPMGSFLFIAKNQLYKYPTMSRKYVKGHAVRS